VKLRALIYMTVLLLVSTVSSQIAAQTQLPTVPTVPRTRTSQPASTEVPNDYPDYASVYVNDFAGLIGADVEADMTSILQDLRNTADVEATVVTIDSYRDYDTDDSTFEEFATSLFNAWGVGDDDSDGVMILMGVDDRKIRVEVGVSYERTLNDEMQDIIDDYALPRFRQGNYEAGIYDTLIQVADAIKLEKGVFENSGTAPLRATPFAGSSTSQQPVVSTRTSSDEGVQVSTPAALGGLAAVAGGGFLGLRRIMRFRPRKCPSCGNPMHRLDEVTDDEFLDQGQRTEESLGSVDYDVWKCDSCGTHQVFDYYGLSFYSHCPQCGYKTASNDSRVIDSATCYHSGLREVSQRCGNCSYNNTWQEDIPRRNCSDDNNSSSSSSFSSSSSSSSSSGGSFGGGRSSGGGASGSW
jgi:uncharacterized protein